MNAQLRGTTRAPGQSGWRLSQSITWAALSFEEKTG